MAFHGIGIAHHEDGKKSKHAHGNIPLGSISSEQLAMPLKSSPDSARKSLNKTAITALIHSEIF